MFFDITHQPKSSEEGTNFRIRVLRQPDVKFDNLAKSLQNCECSGSSKCSAQDCVHTLNILLRSVLSQSEGWFCVNKNLWLSKEAMSIDAEVETSQHVKLHDGMTFSIDLVEKKCGSPSDRKLMLTVSPRPTLFVEACNLGVFYADYIDNFREDAANKAKALRSFIKRLEVTQAYKPSRDDGAPRIIRASQSPGDLPSNARRRQIVSLGQSATEQKFKLDEAGMATEEISVSCYFEQYYGYKLRFPNLPVVNVGDSAKKIWIPMELLWVKEQPVFKFPPLQMKDGFKSIHMKCEESIRNFDANLSDKHSKVVKLLNPTLLKDAFGITFKSEAENITAYFVDSPPEGLQEKHGHVKDKRIKAPKFADSPQMVRFLTLKSGLERHTRKEQEVFEGTCKKLLVAFQTEGGLCDEPKAAYDYDTFQSFLGAVDNAESPLKRFSPKSDMLLLVGLDAAKEGQADAQARIRCWCDKNNVPTVFFDVQKFQENMKHWERSEKGTNVPEIRQAVGYARALVTKAVHRCAGRVPSTQEINPADREDLKKLLKETMVVGASLTSGQSDPSDDLPSIAAVTTSLGDDFVQYQGRFRLQKSGQKTIVNLSDMLKEMLSEYAQAHGNRLPESILYLREGISKDHFHLIRNDEIRKIADAFNELCTQKPQLVVSNAAPNITFIALSKRAKPRFFPDGDRIARLTAKNLKEGIVVDAMDIQAPTAKGREFDFHLQSHSNSCDSAKQCGFISNTHYYVLKHENRWSQEEVERIVSLTLPNSGSLWY
ncbi:Protein argonaute 3 [Lasiodiplodia theobromae]|uniref:Protein argonaute 3 n=1 Tax=Lasiodiplodia theobromae TaxID=45133 RepID=A0A5N5DS16_9PEZI|nr:Protein argonaute 3 [Lasiodiplodia theobromae]